MFRNAIVRTPGNSIKDGLTSSDLGKPDYNKAFEQHSKYVGTLVELGLNVKILDNDDRFPDSTFIEDVALCTPACAVITSPGALSRRGEIQGIRHALEEYYDIIEEIKLPGTLEAGDVMKVGDHYYIGISERTNPEGAGQLISILTQHGMKGTTIVLKNMLHLKSGISYLENNNLLAAGELFHNDEFRGFNRIFVDNDELYAANSLWVNGTVLIPEGFPKIRKKIEKEGYETITLDVSEFRKLDGGLSCLSLRF